MSRYKGSKEAQRALGAYVKLMRAAESVTARVHSHLQPVGLSLSQFGVLEALLHLGPMSQVALTRKLLKTGGNITMVVDNLEKRGLVRPGKRTGKTGGTTPYTSPMREDDS